MADLFETLLQNIESKTARVGVIGSGYVGGSVADAAANAQFRTLGFDIDQKKVDAINDLKHPYLTATTDMRMMAECDILCLCVPTPVTADRKPNLSIIKTAAAEIAKHLRPGQLVVGESSIIAGTSRTVLLPIYETSGLKAGKDFFLGYSPERIDPGNKKYTMKKIPKVVSGLDETSTALVTAFYSKLVEKVVVVSSLEAAELTKVFENTFRLVNISLVNEMVDYARTVGVDMWEVVDAAATKPFGFLAHYPGPGAGGDCIPVLPYHLLESAKDHGVSLPLIEQAASINEHQPKKIVKKTISALNGTHKEKIARGEKPKVMLVGISYKPDNPDIRESVALKIWKLLEEEGVAVSYHDPYVSQINGASSQTIDPDLLKDQDAIVITTAHANVPYNVLVDSKQPLIDTRNILCNYTDPNIIRL